MADLRFPFGSPLVSRLPCPLLFYLQRLRPPTATLRLLRRRSSRPLNALLSNSTDSVHRGGSSLRCWTDRSRRELGRDSKLDRDLGLDPCCPGTALDDMEEERCCREVRVCGALLGKSQRRQSDQQRARKRGVFVVSFSKQRSSCRPRTDLPPHLTTTAPHEHWYLGTRVSISELASFLSRRTRPDFSYRSTALAILTSLLLGTIVAFFGVLLGNAIVSTQVRFPTSTSEELSTRLTQSSFLPRRSLKMERWPLSSLSASLEPSSLLSQPTSPSILRSRSRIHSEESAATCLT